MPTATVSSLSKQPPYQISVDPFDSSFNGEALMGAYAGDYGVRMLNVRKWWHRKGNSRCARDPAKCIQDYTWQTNCLPCYFYEHLHMKNQCRTAFSRRQGQAVLLQQDADYAILRNVRSTHTCRWAPGPITIFSTYITTQMPLLCQRPVYCKKNHCTCMGKVKNEVDVYKKVEKSGQLSLILISIIIGSLFLV